MTKMHDVDLTAAVIDVVEDEAIAEDHPSGLVAGLLRLLR